MTFLKSIIIFEEKNLLKLKYVEKVNKKIEIIIIELKIISLLDIANINEINKNQSGWKPFCNRYFVERY